jgi:putative ABC transport system ATP-binding protein
MTMPAVHAHPAALLQARGLTKRYGSVAVFADVDLDLAAGEVVAILGESGVGKSTLLNVLAGLDSASSGSVQVGRTDVTALDAHGSALWRRVHVGFVFQAFHVLPYLDVRHNVALPLLLLRRPDAQRVQAMIEAVGLGGLESRKPRELSGGQLQRVAIARALVHRPRLVLADEPTGNLDPDTADQVLDLMLSQVHAEGAACLLVTHSRAAAARCDRALRLSARGLSAVGQG